MRSGGAFRVSAFRITRYSQSERTFSFDPICLGDLRLMSAVEAGMLAFSRA